MRLLRVLFVACALAVSFAAVAPAQELTAGSVWVNQRGSLLDIQQIRPDSSFTGTYINKAAGYRCQNTPYPVIGWVIGSAITFSVRWSNSHENCNSVTAWSGFLFGGQIQTKWNLAISGSSDPSQIVSGADVFTPVSVMERQSLVE